MNDNKEFGIIYKVTNKINQKSYIGQTIFTSEVRFKQHLRESCSGSQSYFHTALRKYGKHNFDVNILCTCISFDDMNNKEIYFINKYDTFNRNKGYNLTLGGFGCPGSKQCNKPILQYNLHGVFVKEWSSIKKASEKLGLDRPSISNCCNGKKFRQVGGFIWRHKKDTSKEKVKPINEFRKKNISKPVVKYNLVGDFVKEYCSMNTAAKDNSISCTIIKNNCDGVTVLPKKFIWRYKEEPLIDLPKPLNRSPSKENIDKLRIATSKVTLQYDMSGNLVKEYKSAKEASVELKLHFETIYKACRGQLKTAGGFIWKYKEGT